jgi:hypothetical protein
MSTNKRPRYFLDDFTQSQEQEPFKFNFTPMSQFTPYSPELAGDVNYSMMRKPKYPRKFFGFHAVQRGPETWRRYGPSWSLAGPAQRAARYADSYVGAGRYRRRRYRGRGLYTGAGSYFSRMMGRQLNRTLAGKTPLGQAAKQVGRAALARGTNMALSAIGQGSYKVAGTKGNHLIEGMGSGTPSFQSAGDETGALTVQHTEYIKDIYGNSGTAMDSTIVVINPGLAESFPWLSQVAANYEEYELKQCMFCYKSKVSDNLTSSDGQIGSILMFTEYNANDAMKKTKQQLIQAYGTTNALISTSDVLHGVECDVSKLKGDGHKYIRTENLSINTDKSDYDHAKMQLAVVDAPSQLQNQVVGELYVSYTVVLRKPRLFSTLGLNLQEDQVMLQTNGTSSATGTVDIASAETNSIGCLFTVTGLTASQTTVTITLPASFSGDLEIVGTVDSTASSGNVAFYAGSLGGSATGNVQLIKNIPVTSSASDPQDNQYVNDTGNFPNGNGCGVGHYRVSQASSGIDNTILVAFVGIGSTNPNFGEGWMKISRYNGHETDTAPTFKKLLTDGKVDPQDITMAIRN